MDPLANLTADHVAIARALDAMDGLVLRAGQGELDLGAFHQAADFGEIWSHHAHHGKEELLFDELVAAGVPRRVGPTAVLEMEHRAVAGQLGRMREAIAGLHAGREADLAVLLDATGRYTALLRGHIPKEDLGYFPMSSRALKPESKERLAAEFARIDGALPMPIADAAAALGGTAAAPAPAPAAAPPPGVGFAPPAGGFQAPAAAVAAEAQLRQIVSGLTVVPRAPCVPLPIRRRR